jgi:hypothetical protein
MEKYQKCLKGKNPTSLCDRGYCTAKSIFKVYPSAYANGYATSVCQGKKPDFTGKTFADTEYMRKLKSSKQAKKSNELDRWFNEGWVNVCKKGKGPGGYTPCGRKESDPSEYPYCRPYYKQPGTTVKTVKELTAAELKRMCKMKKGPEKVYLNVK